MDWEYFLHALKQLTVPCFPDYIIQWLFGIKYNHLSDLKPKLYLNSCKNTPFCVSSPSLVYVLEFCALKSSNPQCYISSEGLHHNESICTVEPLHHLLISRKTAAFYTGISPHPQMISATVPPTGSPSKAKHHSKKLCYHPRI